MQIWKQFKNFKDFKDGAVRRVSDNANYKIEIFEANERGFRTRAMAVVDFDYGERVVRLYC